MLPQLKARLETLLTEMEEECAQGEAALRSRRWDEFAKSLWNQRRCSQAIVNELAAEKCTIQTIPEVYVRLQAVFTFRNDQLRRLGVYRTEVSKRLQITRKWKDAARSAKNGIGPAPVLISKVL